MKDKKSFGRFIAEKRKEKGMTQAEVAQALYVTVTAVSKWERGVTYPDITLISDLCEILGVSEHELITAGNDARVSAHESGSGTISEDLRRVVLRTDGDVSAGARRLFYL